jgi:hypothetical protein
MWPFAKALDELREEDVRALSLLVRERGLASSSKKRCMTPASDEVLSGVRKTLKKSRRCPRRCLVRLRHGGDFNGFILLRGEGSKLDALQRSDKFAELTIRATHCLSGFGVIPGWIGDRLQRIMAQWMAAVPR